MLLDGADIAFLHLILDCAAEDVRMGMRVEAVWKPREEWGRTLQNITHFRPSGEPDADYDTFKEHLCTMSARAKSRLATRRRLQLRRTRAQRAVRGAAVRDVVGFASPPGPAHGARPTASRCSCRSSPRCWAASGIDKGDIGFWCSGSSDYLAGRAFSFISAIDAIGPVPPINESHVEADAAWALYEAWVKIQTGEVDTALVYGFGKSSAGNLRRTLALQLDPYTLAPLWPDAVAVAGLQARLGIDAGRGASGRWPRSRCAAAATPRPTRTPS